MRLEGGFDFARIAKYTPGFVGADLLALTKEAAALAVARIFSSLATTPAPAPAPGGAAAEGALSGSGVGLGVGVGVGGALLPGAGRGPLGPEELAGLAITMADYEGALGRVQPSAQREGFATVPDVTWDVRSRSPRTSRPCPQTVYPRTVCPRTVCPRTH